LFINIVKEKIVINEKQTMGHYKSPINCTQKCTEKDFLTSSLVEY